MIISFQFLQSWSLHILTFWQFTVKVLISLFKKNIIVWQFYLVSLLPEFYLNMSKLFIMAYFRFYENKIHFHFTQSTFEHVIILNRNKLFKWLIFSFTLNISSRWSKKISLLYPYVKKVSKFIFLFFKHYNHIPFANWSPRSSSDSQKYITNIRHSKDWPYVPNCSSHECSFIQCLDFKTEIFAA